MLIIRALLLLFVCGLAQAQTLPAVNATLTGTGLCYILSASAAGIAVPADTTEDTLTTVSVPGNTLGANGFLRINAQWTLTGSVNAKTSKIYFGNGTSGTLYYNLPISTLTVLSNAQYIHIYNRNATNSQVGNPAAFTTGSGATTTAVTTSAIDTTAAQSITFTGQKASSGESLILESYEIEVCSKN